MRLLQAQALAPNGEEIVLRRSGIEADTEVTVFLTEHAKAKRISLRVDPIGGRVILVKPRRASKKAATAFAQEKIDWIAEQLAELPKPVPFETGAVVPLHGRPHIIRHCPDARRGVWIEGDEIRVSGSREHLSRRLHDWMKSETRRCVTPLAHRFAEELGKTVTQISVRDTRSRWGSCTSDGKLSFSWRLILTPENVLTYVVAHEVAHLQELNHSDNFWRVVEDLIGDKSPSTDWLKTYGRDLHRYGAQRANATP